MEKFSVCEWGVTPIQDAECNFTYLTDDVLTVKNFTTLDGATAYYSGSTFGKSTACITLHYDTDTLKVRLECACVQAGGKLTRRMTERRISDVFDLSLLKARENKSFAPEPSDDSEWRDEFSRQNGMVFGCDGYNDAMGY